MNRLSKAHVKLIPSIALNLNGDNRIRIVACTEASVAFDADDTDYLKDTAWVGATDGNGIQRCKIVKRQYRCGSSQHLCRRGKRDGGFGGFGLRGLAWIESGQDGIASRIMNVTGLQ